MIIKQLSDQIINQIAAGEVVARPASVIKELVENAIDAQAERIEITIENGGKTLMQVLDDGHGIKADELSLAVSRHCTSKMGENIHDIRALGFRGEALPSIGSVAKLRLTSCYKQATEAAEIIVEGGKILAVKPASLGEGTLVEIRDLFYAVPARLKFMKTERTETAAIIDIVKRVALAYPTIHFTLRSKQKKLLEFLPHTSDDADLERACTVLGEEFAQNSFYFSHESEDIKISGYGSIPSYSCANSLWQFAYVNQRPIQDKLVLHAIRSAYNDFIPKDRYPYIVLFITLPNHEVDVNVHPAKAEVRFLNTQRVRSLIVKAIRSGLELRPPQSASCHAKKMAQMFSPITLDTTNNLDHSPARELAKTDEDYARLSKRPAAPSKLPFQARSKTSEASLPYDMKHTANHFSVHEAGAPSENSHILDFIAPSTKPKKEEAIVPTSITKRPFMDPASPIDCPPLIHYPPLGMARAQLHGNYIIAQTEDSLILVDQHAAHERILYEALKQSLYGKALEKQILLIPSVVQLTEQESSALLEHKIELEKFGLTIEEFGLNTVIIRETPALLGKVDVEQLVKDLAQTVVEHDHVDGLKDALDHVAATMACYGSVRSGRLLTLPDMDKLLRDMENLPQAATCNHGRPTYIELKLKDIEKLFKRR